MQFSILFDRPWTKYGNKWLRQSCASAHAYDMELYYMLSHASIQKKMHVNWGREKESERDFKEDTQQSVYEGLAAGLLLPKAPPLRALLQST